MRCAYKQVNCPGIPPASACFQCEYCSRRVVVPQAMAANIDAMTGVFPNCSKAPTAAPAPLPAETAVAVTTVATPAAVAAEQAAPPTPPAVPAPAPYVWDPAGAGTHLKRLLSKVGIKSTENCSCNARAKIMNERGIEWCEQNVNEIVGWLKEEAAKRKLPFLSFPAKILVQRAIKIAKRARDSQAALAADEEAALEPSTSAAE